MSDSVLINPAGFQSRTVCTYCMNQVNTERNINKVWLHDLGWTRTDYTII